MKIFNKAWIMIILLNLLSGCSENSVSPPVNNEVIVNPNAKLLSSEDFQNSIVSFSSDSSIIILRAGASNINSLAKGNILVTENGNGMIKKIDSIQSVNSNLILNTSKASLTDVFKKLSLVFEKQLTANDTISIDPGEGVKIAYLKKDNSNLFEITLGFERQFEKTIISGEISFSIRYNVDLRVDDYTLQSGSSISFTPSVSIRINDGIGIILPLKDSVRLFNVNYSPFVVIIGGLPVVFTPNNGIYLKLDAEGRITATAEVTAGLETTAGVNYNNGIWNTFASETHNFSFTPPQHNLRIEAKIKTSIEDRLGLKIYGVVGPYLKVGPYASLELTGPPRKVELYGGIEAALGVIVNIFGISLANYEDPLALSIRQKLWESELTGVDTNISVSGRLPATPTGIYINKGDTIQISTSGNWCWSTGPDDCCGPEGEPGRPHPDEHPVTLEPLLFGVPIGKINNSYFNIGFSTNYIANQSGYLFLLMNDRVGFYGDNSGYMNFHIFRK